jgi:hypothetical protein
MRPQFDSMVAAYQGGRYRDPFLGQLALLSETGRQGAANINSTLAQVQKALGQWKNPYQGTQFTQVPNTVSDLSALLGTQGVDSTPVGAAAQLRDTLEADRRGSLNSMIAQLAASEQAAQQTRGVEAGYVNAGMQQQLKMALAQQQMAVEAQIAAAQQRDREALNQLALQGGYQWRGY